MLRNISQGFRLGFVGYGQVAGSCEGGNEFAGCIKCGEFID